MYSYVDSDGMRSTIVLRHATSVFQQDASDTFKVYLDDSGTIPLEIPSECYDSFMEKLGEYVAKQ